MHQVIHIHPDAPTKPPEGAPCNGCGVCCLVEPCPVGMLLSRRRRGACDKLQWSDQQGRYVCGLMVASARGRGLWHWWVRRVIAAGQGCDASVDVEG
ncbi:hypothetical protein [Aquabacterium sp.]|uniref:hypothetical protein n=1 Tax=Aquabacterium sp. TaxID=1872578 RepID=UPI0035AEA513